MAKKGPAVSKNVEAFKHDEAKRKNIPTAEYEALVQDREKTPIRIAYERRNRDLDPQLVWRGKDAQNESDLIVSAAPLYIQEKVHPKALIDDLLRETREREHAAGQIMPDLFSDFNGIPKGVDKTEFYQHDQNWSNRMILGDSLQVMASLAEREGLRGKVQCIYLDPPYGIRFNSNFQWSTTSRDVRDGNTAHITREPEQVKAFRDTWRDGIHSYLSYLRDRLVVARDLLSDSGSIVVQIGDENVHRVRSLMDEVFGEDNYIAQITFSKTAGATSEYLAGTYDALLLYARSRRSLKFHAPLTEKELGGVGGGAYRRVRLKDLTTRALTSDELSGSAALPDDARVFRIDNLTSQSVGRDKGEGAASWFPVQLTGRVFRPSDKVRWKTNQDGMNRLRMAGRLSASENGLYYVRYFDDFRAVREGDVWSDTGIAGFASDKRYVVETSSKVVERCILMLTDPGDLVLDPTCGSGTTAYVAEQWGRRWITIDTSRVAFALTRGRIMGARYPFYLLVDSREGRLKEAEVTRSAPESSTPHGDIVHGFVYKRVPHITLKSIVNNSELEVIWDKWYAIMEPLRSELNQALGQKWEEWEIPRESDESWPTAAKKAHSEWLHARVERQKQMDASIAAKAEFEYLYDKPYEDKKTVRVAGPFTVESLDPHRTLSVDENDELIDPLDKKPGDQDADQSFVATILESLKIAGVQQAHKVDKISFTALTPWAGDLICADGQYIEGSGRDERPRRAAIFIGPEFGTVTRPDLVAAAREAADSGFDVLIACAFSYEAYTTEFEHLGSLRVLKARMNADLHMATDLKNTGKGNLFVVFGEPDIDVLDAEDGKVKVKINGVDVFHPTTGEVRSDGAEGIALWFVDTDYNEESFFVRHAYFLGANDPYGSLKTTLKAEIDEDAWESLHGDVSRAFPKPKSGRIAVKVINHLGDEVMKVFKVT
jgi:adenine-specific DNA-methyltransferase